MTGYIYEFKSLLSETCFQEGVINRTVEAAMSQVTESDLEKPDQNVTDFVISTPPVKEKPKSEKPSVVLKDKVEEVIEVIQESSLPSPPRLLLLFCHRLRGESLEDSEGRKISCHL